MQKYILSFILLIQLLFSGSNYRLCYAFNYSKPFINDELNNDIQIKGLTNHSIGFSFDVSKVKFALMNYSSIFRAKFLLTGKSYEGIIEGNLDEIAEQQTILSNQFIDSHIFLETDLSLPLQIPLSFLNSSNAGTLDFAVGYKFTIPIESYRYIDSEKYQLISSCNEEDCIKSTINNNHGIILSSTYSSPFKLAIGIEYFLGFRNIESAISKSTNRSSKRIFGIDFINSDDNIYLLNRDLSFILTYQF
tara:strand:- start:930 stop:1673 length:744 start_codon:yes stop_codon:yes gene_type:complete